MSGSKEDLIRLAREFLLLSEELKKLKKKLIIKK